MAQPAPYCIDTVTMEGREPRKQRSENALRGEKKKWVKTWMEKEGRKKEYLAKSQKERANEPRMAVPCQERKLLNEKRRNGD